MAVPLTVGKYSPTGAPSSKYGFWNTPSGGGGGGYQPSKDYTPTGTPRSQYGFWGGGAAPPKDQQGGTGVAAPAIVLPQGTPGTPAYTPDYGSMIGGSWEVGAAESAMASQMAAARAQFQAGLRQQFIDLGYSGDLKEGGLGDFSKYIDKTTLQKAIDNKFSQYSQIKKQQTAASDINAALAASQGLIGSGSQTTEETALQSQVEQARYEGLRNFLSGGQAGLSNLANMKASLASGVAQARAAAASRLAQMYPPTPAVPATQPNWDDFWGSYQGGTWSLPGTGGNIVQSGIPNASGGPQPWYVGPGSGTAGDLSWLAKLGLPMP